MKVKIWVVLLVCWLPIITLGQPNLLPLISPPSKEEVFANHQDIYEVTVNDNWRFSSLIVFEGEELFLPMKFLPKDLLETLSEEGRATIERKEGRVWVVDKKWLSKRDDEELVASLHLGEYAFNTKRLEEKREALDGGVPIDLFYNSYRIGADVSKIGEAQLLLSQSWMSQKGWSMQNNMYMQKGRWERLDTTWKRETKDETWWVGDVASPSVIGSGLGLLGVKYASGYYKGTGDMNSFLPTVPISGFALTPSKIDLFVNSRLIQQHEVGIGKYALEVPYQSSGFGTFQAYVYDITGRPNLMSFDFYNSYDVLKPKRLEYTWGLGLIKRQGINGIVYDKPLVSGALKYGVRSGWTQDVSWQLSDYQKIVGTKFHIVPWAKLGKLGVGFLRNQEGQIWQDIGFERIGTSWSISGSVQKSRGINGFCPGYGQACLKEQSQVFFGVPLKKEWGQMSVGWVKKAQVESGAQEVASVLWNKQWSQRISSTGSYSMTKSATGVKHSVYIGLSISLGGKFYANTNALADGDRKSMQQTVYMGENEQHPEYGFGALSWQKMGEQENMGVSYGARLPSFSYFINAFKDKQSSTVNASIDGSLVYVPAEGYLTTTKIIKNGLIFVDVEGATEPVPIMHENKRIGTTDKRGRMIIGQATPKNVESVSLEVNALSGGVTVEEYQKRIRIPEMGAVKVNFKMKPLPFMVQLLGVEPGMLIQVGKEEAVVGEGGWVSLEEEGELRLKTNNGICVQSINRNQSVYDCKLTP